MRLVALCLLALVAGAGCSPRAADPGPAQTASLPAPTATATGVPTATGTPPATAAPTLTPTVLATPSPEPTPSPAPGVQFEIDESVPPKEQGLIEIGIRLAGEYLRDELGETIELPVRVRVATDGVCIGGATAIGYEICVNAASPAWLALAPDYLKVKIAAHEFFHVWQHDRFCYREPKWLFEGLAEWFAYNVIAGQGLVEPAVASGERQQTLQQAPILDPLAAQEVLYAAPQPNQYALWSFAAERLIAGTDADAIPAFCAGNALGLRWQDAFEDAFGEPVNAFYAAFEEWRADFLPYTVP